jgi:hypothetical protein
MTALEHLMLMRCRTCRHANGWHDGGALDQSCLWTSCSCKEFVPSDNLDYVEWLAEKRGLV